MCYNISTYNEPPLGGGRFELPRRLADGCQDRYVCQFHHPPTIENWGECSAKMLLALNPLNHLILKRVFYFVKFYYLHRNYCSK